MQSRIDNEKPELQVEQEAWVSLAERIRTNIGNRVNDIGAMEPTEINQLVEAAQKAYWFHTNCLAFEKTVERELNRTSLFED